MDLEWSSLPSPLALPPSTTPLDGKYLLCLSILTALTHVLILTVPGNLDPLKLMGLQTKLRVLNLTDNQVSPRTP